MRPAHRNDLIAGVLVVAFGVAVLLYVRGFPELPDGQPGPALFPGILASLMVLFGLTLVVQTTRGAAPTADDGRQAAPDGDVTAEDATPAGDGLPTDGDRAGERVTAGQHAGPQHTSGQHTSGQEPTRGAVTITPRRAVGNAAAVLGAVVAYLLVVDHLGFLLTMAAVLTLLMLRLGVRPPLAAGAAVATSVLIFLLFDSFLLVQLPTGPLGLE